MSYKDLNIGYFLGVVFTFVREKAVLLDTGALQEAPTHGDLFLVVDKRAAAFVSLGALAELVIEHAVLLATVLRLQDDVDAALLGVGQRLSGQRVTAAGEDAGLDLVEFLSSQVHLDNSVGRY